MSNFFVVCPMSGQVRFAQAVFQRGIDLHRNFRAKEPTKILESDWIMAATISRDNGSGSPIAIDPKTGSWINCSVGCQSGVSSLLYLEHSLLPLLVAKECS